MEFEGVRTTLSSLLLIWMPLLPLIIFFGGNTDSDTTIDANKKPLNNKKFSTKEKWSLL